MKVRFLPQDITCEIKPNQSVLDVAQENNIFIKSVCGGVPSCAECRVRILEGEYNVLPPSSSELSLIGTAHFVDRRRLSCQLRCFGDVTVDLNEQVAKQNAQASGKVKTRAGQREESVESHAIKGSILAESRSMLSPQTASPATVHATSDPGPNRPGALDRAPKGPRPQPPPRATQPRAVEQNVAPEGDAAGIEKKPGARRRRGGRGRNRNGAPGGGPKSGGRGGPVSGS